MPPALRVPLAVAAGCAVAALAVLVAAALHVDGAAAGAGATPTSLAVGVGIGMAGAALAAYVCARLTPPGRLLLTTSALAAIFAAAGYVAANRTVGSLQPRWYFAMIVLLDFIGVWTGVMTERAIHAGKPRR